MSNEISIALANRLYEQGNYSHALLNYEILAKKFPELSSLIHFNMQLCMQKMGDLGVAKTKVKFPSGSLIFSSVGKKCINIYNRHVCSKNEILDLLNSIDSSSVRRENINSIVSCALSSPFQRDLLYYAWTAFSESGIKIDEIDCENFSLIYMMKMISNHDHWVVNRHSFKKWLEEQSINDIRAYDIFENPPILNCSKGEVLPRYKKISKDFYRWKKNNNEARKIKIHFGSILLNEKRFIGLNLLQHYDLCDSWTLVEGACQGYPTRKVSEGGLSLDNSSVQIRLFPDPFGKIEFIQHGWTVSDGEAAKSELRNVYLKSSNANIIVVIDADEFYLKEDFNKAIEKFEDPNIFGVTLPQVHFWKSTERFITGDYYDISHTRFFRNVFGMSYIKNHNFPEINGALIHEGGNFKYKRTIDKIQGKFSYLEPKCYHMGFAKDFDDMRDKSDYYINRGEKITRKSTTESRAAWFDGNLPENCLVRDWGGELPEVLMRGG